MSTVKMKSRIIIFGCDHRLQKTGTSFLVVEKQLKHEEQQRHFTRTLASIFLKERITFVGEEIGHSQLSLIQAIAYGLVCPYFNIDLPPGERIRLGCPPDYNAVIQISGYFTNQSPEEIEQKILRCNEIREDYMAKRILEFASDADSGLILCGATHAEGLQSRCEENFSEVRVTTLSEYSWFDKDFYNWKG